MNKLILFTLLLLTGCVQGQNNQDMIIAIQDCEKAELRAVWIHNSEGIYAIQCREYKKEKIS